MTWRTPTLIAVSVCFTAIASWTPARGLVARAQTEFPERSVWRAAGDARVYLLESGRKRHLATETILRAYGFAPADVREGDSEVIFSIPDVRVVKLAGSDVIYDIVEGVRIPFASAEEFLADGFTWDEVVSVNQAELESYPLSRATASATGTQPVATPTPTPQFIPAFIAQVDRARALLAAQGPTYPTERRVEKAGGTLSRGTSGAEVELVQKALQDLGYFPKATEPNGNFGPATEKAVRAFQKAKKISQTGSVGPKTRSALVAAGYALPAAGQVVRSWRATVPTDREVLLAVWNPATDEQRVLRVTLATDRVKVGKKTQTVTRAVSKTPGFTVRYRGGNGVNVHYGVAEPAGWQVLANRFPIFDAAAGRVGTFPPREEVYVPYSPDLLTPEVVAAGRAYLDQAVSSALQALRAKGVMSASGRGLVADLTDPDELKNIALIEHIDHNEFRRSEDKHGVINKVFAVLGTNREGAYRFSGSSAGALGLAQFIKNTYKSITKQYPAAALIPDFTAGMTDHVNALQAMALYHDVTGATLAGVAQERLAIGGDDLVFALAEVRAAAYNGGAGRVRIALNKFGSKWDSTVSSRYGLRAETRTYLEKFRVVRSILKAPN